VSVGRYAQLVAFILGLSLLGLLALGQRLDPATRTAVLCGALLATANTLAAYFLGVWSESRSTQAFFNAVLGGMLVRMTFMFGAVLLGALVLGLPRVPLVLSLLGYFVLFLVLELTFLHRRTSHRS
jgi:hypothetical protein